MLKYLLSIKEAFGLQEVAKNTLYGYCGDYETTIYSTVTSQEGITVYLNFYADEDYKQQIIKEFINYEGKALAGGQSNTFGVKLTLNGFTAAGAAKKLIVKLRYIISMMKDQGVKGKGFCPACGEELSESEKIQVNDVYVTVDSACANSMREASTMQAKEFKEIPGNYFKGFLGSLIGATVGCVAWFVLYQLGFVSALIALFAVMLADFLYVKFEGKKDKFRVLISTATVLVMFELVCFLTWLIAGSGLAALEGSNLSGLAYVLSDPELKGAFIYDMIMNLVFTGIGAVIQGSIIAKKNKQEKLQIK